VGSVKTANGASSTLAIASEMLVEPSGDTPDARFTSSALNA